MKGFNEASAAHAGANPEEQPMDTTDKFNSLPSANVDDADSEDLEVGE